MVDNNTTMNSGSDRGREDVERSFREDETEAAEAAARALVAERERIGRAIVKGEGFLSEDMKEHLREIEYRRGIPPNKLVGIIEGRIKRMKHPTVEQVRAALSEEMKRAEAQDRQDSLLEDDAIRAEQEAREEAERVRAAAEEEESEARNARTDDKRGTSHDRTCNEEEGSSEETSEEENITPLRPEGHYVPGTDPPVKNIKAPPTPRLRSQGHEADRQYRYIDDLVTAIEGDLKAANTRAVKSHKRALISGLRDAEEAIRRAADAHKWTSVVFQDALDEVRGRAVPILDEVEEFLKDMTRKDKQEWAGQCLKLVENTSALASQVSRHLTISDWSLQDCEEFMEDLDKEAGRARKMLLAHLPQDCDAATRKRIAAYQTRLETVYTEAARVLKKLVAEHHAWGRSPRDDEPQQKEPPGNPLVTEEDKQRCAASKASTGARKKEFRFGNLEAICGIKDHEGDSNRPSAESAASSTPKEGDSKSAPSQNPRGGRNPTPEGASAMGSSEWGCGRGFTSDWGDMGGDGATARDRGGRRRGEDRSASPELRRSRSQSGHGPREASAPPWTRDPYGEKAKAPVPPASDRNFRGYAHRNPQSNPCGQNEFNVAVLHSLRSVSANLMTINGRAGKNNGFPYFDGTYKGYPSFKRRWHTFQNLHHISTPQKELVYLFRENCMEKKTSERIKRMETMAACWRMLDTFFDRPVQFARDLMAEITSFKKIHDSEHDKLLEYYVLLQTNIDEADKAGLRDVLLHANNLVAMESLLPPRELMLWREAQGALPMRDHGTAFMGFVARREVWVSCQIANSTLPLPEPTGPTNTGSLGSRRSMASKEARVMVAQVHSNDKTIFPPPKKWDPDGTWIRDCIVDGCTQKHAPPQCPSFKKLDPDERLAVVRRKELCVLCFRHLDIKRCWSLGRVPVCGVGGCTIPHSPLLHEALQEEGVMIINVSSQAEAGEDEGGFRCRQWVPVEKGSREAWVTTLYDWGATVSVITKESASDLKLVAVPKPCKLIRGLGGRVTTSSRCYLVPLVSRTGAVKTITAWEVDEIAFLPAGDIPEDITEQFPRLGKWTEPSCLKQEAGNVELLIGMDNANLMPEHVAESIKECSQLRLLKSLFGHQYILVGEGAPKLTWSDEIENEKKREREDRKRTRRVKCELLVEKARQKLAEEKREARPMWPAGTGSKSPGRPKGTACDSTCETKMKLWKQELSSLDKLVGALSVLLGSLRGAQGMEWTGVCEKRSCFPMTGDAGYPLRQEESWLPGYQVIAPALLMLLATMVVRIWGFTRRHRSIGGGAAVAGRFEVETDADGNNEPAPRGRESASSGSRPLSGEDRELLH